MRRTNLAGYFVVMAVVLAVLSIVAVFLLQWLWAWIIPDLFSGAVKNGNLPAMLTLWQTVKLEILLAVLFGGPALAGSRSK